VLEALDTITSGLGAMLKSDLTDRQLNGLWGYCRADSVSSKVLETFAAISGNAFGASRAPSGIIHTYGYLLSGDIGLAERSKRHRWTSGAISRFFGVSYSHFWSKSTTFLRSLTQALQALPDVATETALNAPHNHQFLEVGRFDEHCTDHRWRSRWQVFENGTSATREHESSEEAHLLVYRVGLLEGPLKFSTAFPVRRERVDELTRNHEADGPKLRFNSCVPQSNS